MASYVKPVHNILWIRLCTLFSVMCTQACLKPVHASNNVEATFFLVDTAFDFVERTKFQYKTRSTLLLFWATKSNVASTLLPKVE